MCPWCDFGDHFGYFGCPGPHLDPKRAQGPRSQTYSFCQISGRIPRSFWGAFGAPFRYFRAPGTLKKGVREGLQNYIRFLSILGSARMASGGFPSTRELNFNFCSRTEKGLQNGSQKGAFWAPKSELYPLWGSIWETLVPKKMHRKKVANLGG